LKGGIIRCQLTEDMSPGTTDFKIAREGTMAFSETGPVDIHRFCFLRGLLREEGGHEGTDDG
jgi:hypothetical protein